MRNYKEHSISSGSTIKLALKQLDVLAKDAILFVVDANEILIGSLTDGDVRRGLLKGISIENLANISNVDRNYISDIEKGKRNVSIEIIEKIITAFNSDFATFFNDKGFKK